MIARRIQNISVRTRSQVLPKVTRCDRLLLRGNDFLALLTQLLDPKRHHIAGLEKYGRWFHAKTDARRRAGDDDVARLHHEELRAVPDQVLAVEDHGLRIASLTFFAVDVEPHVEILRVLDFILGDEPRSDRSEGLAAFALVPLAAAPLDLENALGHVVAQEITGDRVF